MAGSSQDQPKAAVTASPIRTVFPTSRRERRRRRVH